MEKFLIKGGIPLKGDIEIFGSKNAILPMIAGSLLAEDGNIKIKNVPDLIDIKILSKILVQMGARIRYNKNKRILELNCKEINPLEVNPKLVGKIRGSLLLLGPMLARFGKFNLWMPGGCKIGERNIDIHINGLKRLGAEFRYNKKFINVSVENLKGTNYYLKFPSQTGTENLIMASCLAEGKTYLYNASCEPDIEDFAFFLNSMGARIKGAGTPIIRIEGVKSLSNTEYKVIPSRIEAGFFIAATLITKGDIIIHNVIRKHIDYILKKMQDIGVVFNYIKDNELHIISGNSLRPINVRTSPFPGFPTDFQPQLTAVLSKANGKSIIKETIFEDRFKHIKGLNKLGANIKRKKKDIHIHGKPILHPATVKTTDIQTGAALLLAALSIDGCTIINNIHHLDRGYEKLDLRLNKLGASIYRYL